MVVMILLALSLILNAYLAIKLILAQRAIDKRAIGSAIQLTKELIKTWDVASQVIGEIKERSDEC
jgi:hypothetical protein